jgi:hypothetical protein
MLANNVSAFCFPDSIRMTVTTYLIGFSEVVQIKSALNAEIRHLMQHMIE